MEGFTNIICIALMALYGIAGVFLVVCQERIGHVIAVAAVTLLVGFFLYPFLSTIATVIAWIVVIAVAVWLLKVFFC